MREIRIKMKFRNWKLSHLTPALSPTKHCGGEGEMISALEDARNFGGSLERVSKKLRLGLGERLRAE
jgi:hypothetical protein